MKWWQYILCLVVIVVSIFFAFDFYDMYTSHSISRGGGFDIDWSQSVEEFSYQTTSLSLVSEDEVSYSMTIKCNAVQGFDGNENDYILIVNETMLSKMNYGTATISGELHLESLDTDKKVIISTTLKIEIKFLVTGTTIKISCNDGLSGAEFWHSYVKSFGLRIKLDSLKGVEL